mgnify:CR=1 FL=1
MNYLKQNQNSQGGNGDKKGMTFIAGSMPKHDKTEKLAHWDWFDCPEDY